MFNEYYLVDRVEENQESASILFNYYVIFDHAKIIESFKGQMSLEKFVVTVGGFKTLNGFQYSLIGLDHLDAGRAYEQDGKDYPVNLPEGHMISELVFSHRVGNVEYCVKIMANLMRIQPKPNRDLINKYIKILKEALTTSHLVYLQNAKDALTSAKNEFLKGSYRSCAHNTYYSLFNAVKALAAREGKRGKLKHGSAGSILREILNRIKNGTYVTLSSRESDPDNLEAFQNLDIKKYHDALRDAYKNRQVADYMTDFEVGVVREMMSKLISIAEELVTLADYILNGCTVIDSKSGRLILYLISKEEDKPYPSDLLEDEFIGLAENKLLLSGFASGCDFNASKLAHCLLLQNQIFFTDTIPPRNLHLLVRYEKGKK